jgi:hypothetical protein
MDDMEIQKETERQQQEAPKKTLVDEANEAAERLEKANERQAELLRQQQELETKRMLGGRSDAGQTPEKPAEETPKEYADKMMSGKLEVK